MPVLRFVVLVAPAMGGSVIRWIRERRRSDSAGQGNRDHQGAKPSAAHVGDPRWLNTAHRRRRNVNA
jgi:hypothetical protein